jgi:sulfur carrier protein
MHLFINGDEKAFAEPLSLAELIEQLGMKGDRVAVELNREIVARAYWTETKLNDGDRLEIVHFVGGGLAAIEQGITFGYRGPSTPRSPRRPRRSG